jgi:hypothetical protein
MKLLKLHGSLSWRYARPNNGSGGLIYETAGLGKCKWNGESLSSAWPTEWWADLEPMIVPPAAVKSPYYSNSALQANWRIAAEKLCNAPELIMMGFSLPQTDLLVNSMLATTLRQESRITPVNRSDDIVARIGKMLHVPENSERIDSSFVGRDDAIPAWVDAHTGQD